LSSEPGSASMPACGSPIFAKRSGIVDIVKSAGSQSGTSCQRSGAETRASGSGRSAAMLAAILAGASPARGTCPVATVAISGDETGDQFIGSPEVKVPVGRAAMLGQIRQGGKQLNRS
jgi:hypothetical protein